MLPRKGHQAVLGQDKVAVGDNKVRLQCYLYVLDDDLQPVLEKTNPPSFTSVLKSLERVSVGANEYTYTVTTEKWW